MSKKILILCSSPRRNGNTNTVVQWCIEGASAAGAEVECIDVAHLSYKNNGCIACYGCQKSDKYECVVQDDATPILKRIPDFDMLVFATPIYYCGPSAQLKLFMDRMFCLVKINPETGEASNVSPDQSLAVIATAGGELKDGLDLLEQTFKAIADFSGAKLQSLLIPHAPFDPQQFKSNTELMQKAQTFGRDLAASN